MPLPLGQLNTRLKASTWIEWKIGPLHPTSRVSSRAEASMRRVCCRTITARSLQSPQHIVTKHEVHCVFEAYFLLELITDPTCCKWLYM